MEVCFAIIYFSTADFCIEYGSGITVLCAFFQNKLEIQIDVMDRGESSRFECKLCFGWFLTLQQPQIFINFLITTLWIKPQYMCITMPHTASQNSKVHGANMGPIWGPTGPRWAPCWPHELCFKGHHSLGMIVSSNLAGWYYTIANIWYRLVLDKH